MNVLVNLKSYVDRCAERLQARCSRPATTFSISHNANAATISWRKSLADCGDFVVAWRDIIRIEAFKRDLLTVDLICLNIVVKHGTQVEINEEMEGWESLVEKLPEYLPGCQTFGQWFLTVAFPAFKPNFTVIYKRNE
jgi:hypothetical protein